jgi:DNA-directed RNA polymerase subunit M
MEFCPNCGTRLIYKAKSKVNLYCTRCKYKSGFSGIKYLKVKPATTKRYDTGIAVLDKQLQKLRTFPIVNLACQKCEGRKVETWTMAFGSEDNSQATFFRCTSCRHTWRETE